MTLIAVLSHYAEQLAAAEGRLYLSGVDPELTGLLTDPQYLRGPVRVYAATEILSESTLAAVQDATAWTLERTEPGPA